MPHLIDFPSGGSLFLDANIFLEHMLRAELSCTALFQQLQVREVRGVTSVVVVAEVRHRLLLTEALRQGYITNARRALETLRQSPHILRRLDVCDSMLNQLIQGASIRIVSVTPAQFQRAQRLSIKHHLLTNDALHVATMRAHHLRFSLPTPLH